MKLKIILLFYVVIFTSTVWADSKNIEMVGQLPFGAALDVYVVDGYAYLCAGGSIVILDVSNPSSPTEIGYFQACLKAWFIIKVTFF